MRSVWRPNSVADVHALRWRAESGHYTSDENIVWHAHRLRQRAREAVASLSANVGEAESHSPAPRVVPGNPCRRNRVMVDVAGSDHDGSIIDLTCTCDVQGMCSDEEELVAP